MTLLLKVSYDPERQGRKAEAEVSFFGHLRTVLEEGHALARKLECGITFEFNERTIDIWPDEDPAERFRHYQQRWEASKE